MATEKRLICAGRHERVLRRFAEHLMERGMVEGAEAVKSVIKCLVLEPTVDAEKVIRCGKCKWYDNDSEFCQFWHGVRHYGHYCGEGAEDGN